MDDAHMEVIGDTRSDTDDKASKKRRLCCDQGGCQDEGALLYRAAKTWRTIARAMHLHEYLLFCKKEFTNEMVEK